MESRHPDHFLEQVVEGALGIGRAIRAAEGDLAEILQAGLNAAGW